MKIWDNITSNKKTFFNLITLLVLVLGIPLGVYLARQTQVFNPQAANDPISWVVEGCIIERNGVKIARCPQVKFAIDSPFGGPQGGGPSCPTPTPKPTSTPPPICTPASPKAIVELALDDSTSMECISGKPADQCKVKQLQTAVREMKALIRPVDVIGIQNLKNVLLPINTIDANKNKYDQVINNFQTKGGTPLKDALIIAETEVKRAEKVFTKNPKKVVILVTDGCPDDGQNPKAQGEKLKNLGWTVAILAIQLGTEADGSESPKCRAYGGKEGARRMMKDTASEDLFFEVEDPKKIPASLKSIFTEAVCTPAASLNKQPTVAGATFTPANFASSFIKVAHAQNNGPTNGDGGNNSGTSNGSSNGLVGHWKFNENSGTTASDSSGNGKNGTLTNGPTWASGKSGSSIKFDGNNDYVTIPDAANLRGTGAFTVAFWTKFDRVNSDPNATLVSKYTTNKGWRIRMDGSSKIRTSINGGCFGCEGPSTPSLSPNTWYHVAVTVAGSNKAQTVYLNGKSEGTAQSGEPTDTGPINIGRDPDNTSFFKGQIDDLRIYNRALSASEVSELSGSGGGGGGGDACIGTESYKYAETAAALDGLPEIPYEEGITIDHTFSNPKPGTKTIFVRFKPKVGSAVTKQLSIEMLPEPEITNVDCAPSSTGTGVSLTLDGINFGSQNGTVKGNETATTVTNWKTTQVIVTSNTLTCNEIIRVLLTTKDGDEAEGIYDPNSQIALGAKLFCRAPQKNDQENVVLTILGKGENIATESVSIDKDGLVRGLKKKLEKDKKYQIAIKAPKSVKTLSFPFISRGTAQLVLRSRERDLADRRYINVLPIGDIITLGKGDGVINAIDKSELNKEWGFGKGGVVEQPGDFNQDGKVNSVDWACMRFDFGAKDAIGPNKQTLDEPIDGKDACIPDTFVCPDGSTVGRVLPDCEFIACPNVTAPPITPVPSSTATPVPFTWNLSGQFSCQGANPKSTITWSSVPNASKYDVYKNNALVLADQTALSVALLGDAVGITSNFVVKAKNNSNAIVLTSANIPITAGSCSGSSPSPTAAATSTPQPTPTP